MSPRDPEDRTRRQAGRSAAEGGLPPGEFEDIELPTEAPEEVEGEFEDIEAEMAAFGAAAPDEQLVAAKETLEQQLLLTVTEQAMAAESGTTGAGFENIVGVGISEKMRDDEYTGQPCVTVYVVAKEHRDAVEQAAFVPAAVNGIPTDVVATGEILALPFRGRYRPAWPGVSIGHYRITAGTFGCLVRRSRALFVLSNNHVLANSNNAQVGNPVLQPGPADGGRVPRDVIGRVAQFVPINFGGAPNQVDAAIAQVKPSLVSPVSRCYGRIAPTPFPCRRDLLVKKCGRTTQFTKGRVTDCHATLRVGYGTAGVALFQNQIVIRSLTSRPFSAPGDSGSLIVTDRGNRPVGLLFAGSATHTIANHIDRVLTALNVTVVS